MLHFISPRGLRRKNHIEFQGSCICKWASSVSEGNPAAGGWGRCNCNRLGVCKVQAQVHRVLNSLGPTSGNSIEVPQKKSPDFKIEGSRRPQCLGRTWLEAHYCVLFGPLPTWSGSSNTLHLKPCTFCARKQRTVGLCFFSKEYRSGIRMTKTRVCLLWLRAGITGMSHHT